MSDSEYEITLARLIAGALGQMPGTAADAFEAPPRGACVSVRSQEGERSHLFEVMVRKLV